MKKQNSNHNRNTITCWMSTSLSVRSFRGTCCSPARLRWTLCLWLQRLKSILQGTRKWWQNFLWPYCPDKQSNIRCPHFSFASFFTLHNSHTLPPKKTRTANKHNIATLLQQQNLTLKVTHKPQNSSIIFWKQLPLNSAENKPWVQHLLFFFSQILYQVLI